MILTVSIEWPGGHEDIDVELDDGLTPEEIDAVAQETFFDRCNYGYSLNGEPQ